MTYSIERPPVLDTFELPSREKLLKLTPLDMVKLTFSPEDETGVERMWVMITKQNNGWEWEGIVDNDALGSLKNIIPAGTLVKFHPLDIIQISENHKDKRKNSEYLEKAYGIKID
jgi:hypothetical protein